MEEDEYENYQIYTEEASKEENTESDEPLPKQKVYKGKGEKYVQYLDANPMTGEVSRKVRLKSMKREFSYGPKFRHEMPRVTSNFRAYYEGDELPGSSKNTPGKTVSRRQSTSSRKVKLPMEVLDFYDSEESTDDSNMDHFLGSPIKGQARKANWWGEGKLIPAKTTRQSALPKGRKKGVARRLENDGEFVRVGRNHCGDEYQPTGQQLYQQALEMIKIYPMKEQRMITHPLLRDLLNWWQQILEKSGRCLTSFWVMKLKDSVFHGSPEIQNMIASYENSRRVKGKELTPEGVLNCLSDYTTTDVGSLSANKLQQI